MFVVDTNLLVYAADEDSPFHARSHAALDGWRRRADAWFLTWGIVYEFLRVATHAKVFRKPWPIGRAWEFVSVLLDSPGLSILVPTERHAEVAAGVLAEVPDIGGNRVHDATTAILMREHGIRRIYTRDTDFHRFGFIEPVDPLSFEVHESKPRRAGGRTRR